MKNLPILRWKQLAVIASTTLACMLLALRGQIYASPSPTLTNALASSMPNVSLHQQRKVFYLSSMKGRTTSFHAFMAAHGFNSVHDPDGSHALLGLVPDAATVLPIVREHGLNMDAIYEGLVDPRLIPQFLDIVRGHDVFSDSPWLLLYRLADKHFPSSKFVLGLRDTEEWLTSFVSSLRRFIYLCLQCLPVP